MRNAANHFHLAIPTHDLPKAWEFYVERLGCASGKRYNNRITLDFFGDQLVCHLAPNQIDKQPEMYPRHFGLIIEDADEYQALLSRARQYNLSFFREEFVRFEGREEEHRSFFLIDPSNNLIEFKHYRNSGSMY